MAGYVHQWLSHSENLVDSDTGAHTQGIKRALLDAKGWSKRSRGNKVHLHSNLDEAAYRRLRSPETHSDAHFGVFLNDMSH